MEDNEVVVLSSSTPHKKTILNSRDLNNFVSAWIGFLSTVTKRRRINTSACDAVIHA